MQTFCDYGRYRFQTEWHLRPCAEVQSHQEIQSSSLNVGEWPVSGCDTLIPRERTHDIHWGQDRTDLRTGLDVVAKRQIFARTRKGTRPSNKQGSHFSGPRWAGHVVRMGERNAYKVLVGKP